MHKQTMKAPTIESARVALRELKESDLKSLFEIYSNRRAMKYWDTIPHEDISITTNAFHKLKELMEMNQGLSWGITLKETNNIIGHFVLHGWNTTRNQTQLGYIINPEYWGKGLGSETLYSVINFCFIEMSFNSILAEVDPNNLASIAILQKHGFAIKEEKKKDLNINNNFYDTNVYELVKIIA